VISKGAMGVQTDDIKKEKGIFTGTQTKVQQVVKA
jgi:hypothetical protein